MEIRLASTDDLAAINSIYNQSIATGYSTCDTAPISLQERGNWFAEHASPNNPVYVAVADKQVIGWIALSAYRKGRKALEKTVEVSYFIDENFRGHGIGSQLLQHALNSAETIGLHNIFAILLETNAVSLALLDKFKFKKWGHLPDVAELNGKLVGQMFYGLKLK